MERHDRLTEQLKYPVRVDVLKNHSYSFKECARIALYVDWSICRASSGARAYEANENRDALQTPCLFQKISV